jgi:hypothetical protein
MCTDKNLVLLVICREMYLDSNTISFDLNSRSATQEIPHRVWNPQYHCRDHNSLLMGPILSQLSPLIVSSPSLI